MQLAGGQLREISWPAERVGNVFQNVKYSGLGWQIYHLHLGKIDVQKKRPAHVKCGRNIALKELISKKERFPAIFYEHCYQLLLRSLFVQRKNIN